MSLEKYFPDSQQVPEDPDLYVEGLFNAIRRYKNDLCWMISEGIDIGHRHRVEPMHVETWPTPWFRRTKNEGTPWSLWDFVADAARRFQGVLHTGLRGLALQDTSMNPENSARVSINAATEFLRMAMSFQLESNIRGSVVTPEAIFLQVRKNLWFASRDVEFAGVTRPILVMAPQSPLWRNAKVVTAPQKGIFCAFSPIPATKEESRIARHLIGPDPNEDVDPGKSVIARIIEQEFPFLLVPNRGRIFTLHEDLRRRIKRLLGTDPASIGKDSIEEIFDLILDMADRHPEISPENTDEIRRSLAEKIVGESGGNLSFDEAYAGLLDPASYDFDGVMEGYINPLYNIPEQQLTPALRDEIFRRIPILMLQVAIMVSKMHKMNDDSEEGERVQMIKKFDTVLYQRMSWFLTHSGRNPGVLMNLARLLIYTCDRQTLVELSRMI